MIAWKKMKEGVAKPTLKGESLQRDGMNSVLA
jgi:hypothetical protein